MANDADRVMKDALALGRANAQVIDLARRHCTRMTFTEWGGRGMAEAASGLPINARRVHCAYAQGNSAGANLDWIATDFYEEHCVGCEFRRPTGEIPNLASVVDARQAEADVAAESQKRAAAQERAQWRQRAERRQALMATCDPAMAQALIDAGIVDAEPDAPPDEGTRAAALRRLIALAERAADAFTDQVIDLMLSLVDEADVTPLLAPLRHLAARRQRLSLPVLSVAVSVLGRGPDIEAGRCISDFRGLVAAAAVDDSVVRSLVFLAGAPEPDMLGHHRRGTANDPGGLRVAADAVPDRVVSVLRAMLPPPAPPQNLLLPAGEARPVGVGDFQRASAAAAASGLAATHPKVAASLAGDLVRNLGVDSDDHYDEHAIGAVKRALATMLVLDVGDVGMALESAGWSAAEELQRRLFDVYEQAGRLLDPADRWRQPGDPHPMSSRRRAVFDQLVAVGLARVGGDWGHNTAYAGAELIDALAGMEPEWALEHLDGILGAVLSAVGRIKALPQSRLEVIDATPPELLAMEEFGRRNSFSSAARELLTAVERVAHVDVAAVCDALAAILRDERDPERGPEVVRRVLPLLGRIGRRLGHEPGVLRSILPTLHSYLVDAEPALRAAALDAWLEVASSQSLPSSVADLLPALLTDFHVVVVQALLRAACRLTWSNEDRVQLILYALRVCDAVDAREDVETLKEAMTTVGALTRGSQDLRSFGEGVLLRRASELHGYDLRDTLQMNWLPEVAHSAEMAVLRLEQARDPRINDRFNAGDDEELCALLDCGAGLLALGVEQLTDAALDLTPDSPLAAAEFAEVAWRANRAADAASIMRAVRDSTPNVPAYDSYRALIQLFVTAAGVDLAAAADAHIGLPLSDMASALDAIGYEDNEVRTDLFHQVRARAVIRCLLQDRQPPSEFGGTAGDHPSPGRTAAEAKRERADQLATAASDLDRVSKRATVTGAYMRAIAGLCEIGEHLLRFDAAELEADTDSVAAHQTAVRRRVEKVEEEISRHFSPDDPLAEPLMRALAGVRDIHDGGAVPDALRSWARLPLPILVVSGPRRVRRPGLVDVAPEVDSAEQPVAVVFASIDGRLITGPQVLRPDFVYELQLDVRPGAWPEWAERLEAELVSHLSAAEVETPTFTWRKGATGDPSLIGAGTLLLRFGLGAGQPAPPFLVSLHWRGTREGEATAEAIDVAGHSQIRLRPFDASRDYLTDFPVFDERLLALYESLHGAGYEHEQIQAFCRLFTAVCRAGLTMTWDKAYKRGTRVSEGEFHDDLFGRLLKEPELGGRLDRGSPLALGYLDVRHDGITAELKVERRTPVTRDTASKYMGQPTQYAAADGARLSILCVLDLSPKEAPIGTPENYTFTLQPVLHGLDNPEAPSLVAVIVVNGNVPTPSSWSRRKANVQQRPTA